jgi:hypothetical protein
MLRIIKIGFHFMKYPAAIFLTIIISLYLYFKIPAPEGCAVLQHYYFGNEKN